MLQYRDITFGAVKQVVQQEYLAVVATMRMDCAKKGYDMGLVSAGERSEIAPVAPLAGKPPELEDALNRWLYHPLARRLALALRFTPVSPNMVSIAGGLLVVAAGIAYTWIDWPVGVLIGFMLHISWHVVDGADGDLARMTGKASAFGELVDGICDYAGHIALYLMLGAMLDNSLGVWGWAATAAAGLSRIVQANYAESQRRTYLWRAYGVPWLQQSQSKGDELFRKRNWLAGVFGGLATGYLKLSKAMSPHSQALNDLIARTGDDPPGKRRIARMSRTSFGATRHLQQLLGANARTIVLGASMALGSPLWFFLFECALSFVLVAAIIQANRIDLRVLHALARPMRG